MAPTPLAALTSAVTFIYLHNLFIIIRYRAQPGMYEGRPTPPGGDLDRVERNVRLVDRNVRLVDCNVQLVDREVLLSRTDLFRILL